MTDSRRGDELAGALGRRLGGRVHGLHRLSGGASRVTSAFELEAADGRRPLILQVERGRGPTQGKTRTERDLLEAAGAGGVPVPTVVAMGEDDDIGPAWLVVERLEGETIPRKILRDARLDDRPRRAHRAVRARPGRHPRHRPRRRGRPAPGRPAARSPAPARCPGRGAPRARARGTLAGRAPARARPPRHRPRRLPLRQPPRRRRRAARRARLGAGPRRRPGRGHRMALRPGLALRRPGRGRRVRPARRAARRLPRRRRRHRDPGPGALVAGLRHGQVGRHLRAAGGHPPRRADPLGGAGRHRPPRLRERVGPLRPPRGDAARRPPRARTGGRTLCRPSDGPVRPSSSRRCASTSTASPSAARAPPASRPASPATR